MVSSKSIANNEGFKPFQLGVSCAEKKLYSDSTEVYVRRDDIRLVQG